MSCHVVGCKSNCPKKFVFCGEHWYQLPNELRLAVREGTAKFQHTLRAHPTKEWLQKAAEKLGMKVRIPVTVGFGFSAIKKTSVKDAQAMVG
jgi:hypothetical protein